MHVLDPVEAKYVPARHEEQTVADAAEYVPAAQIPVTAESPVVAQYDPAAQAEHEVKPDEAAKVPVEQLVQLVCDAEEV